jgi:DNA-directed RNA polymerase specialized sigma24 family protein
MPQPISIRICRRRWTTSLRNSVLLSYEEIGATLGGKLGTVRSRIHRGRQALKAALERRRVGA